MKHLRLLNLIVVMLLLAAWAPAPAALTTAPGSVLAAPAGPSLLQPASGALITGYRPTFSWTKPTYDPVTYTLEISTDSYFKNLAKQVALIENIADPDTGPVTYTPDFDLPSNSKLYWRVRAVDDGPVLSNWSAARYLRTKPLPVTVTSAPTGTVTSLRPVFSWTVPKDADDVVRNNKFDLQILKAGAVVKSATVTGGVYPLTTDLLRNTAYQWRVRSHGTYFNTDYTALVDFATPDPPSVPTLVSPANAITLALAVGYRPVFDWSNSTSTPGLPITYTLQLSNQSNFSSIFEEVEPLADSTYNWADQPEQLPNATYYWRVRAVDSGGAASNWSAVRSFKTRPALNILVRDYLTKEPIEDATVTITGLVLADPTTDADGMVEIPDLAPGTKSVRVTYEDMGYVAKTVSVSVPAGAVKNVTVELVHYPLKFVLTWNSSPKDLDLHLWLPEDYAFADEDYRGHVRNNWLGTIFSRPWARLSADDYNGYGPETLTVQNTFPGDYVLAVYKASSDGLLTRGNAVTHIPGSNATIKVYRGGRYWATFQVPEAGTGRWWNVLTISGEDGILHPVNVIQTASPGPYDPLGGTAVDKE